MRTQRQTNPKALGLLLLIGLWTGQVWIVTAGWSGWPQYTTYYRLLTQGFLHGQLSLSEKPDAKLLALADPYDPEANIRLRLHDAVLFNGKYYLYWGPVPALVAAAVCWPLRIWHPTFGDQYMVLGFMFGASALAMILIFQVRRRMFPWSPDWTVAAPVLSLGWGGTVLYTLARPGVYEAAITGGQFFLLAGITAAWFAIVGKRWWLLAAAGFWWTLAVGCRLSLGPAVVVIAGMTAWGAWRSQEDPHPSPLPECRARRKRAKLAALAGMMAPLCAGVILLGWYNHARFGSVKEFGLQYQLAAQNQHAMARTGFFSFRYTIDNLLIYLLMPPHTSRYFPYLEAEGWQDQVKQLLRLPKLYHLEPSVGLAWTEPLLVLAGMAVWKWRRWRQEQSGAAAWLAAVLLAGAVVGFGPVLMMWGSTMRYLVDVVPCGCVLAAMGGWVVLEKMPSERARRALAIVVGVVVVAEVAMGFVLGLNGYYHHFAMSNLRLLSAMRETFKRLIGQ